MKRDLDQNGISNCWFAYFGEGVADYSYYGIPCKPLITADSLYFGPPHDVPTAIDGPVLMSAGVLSGFEFGPGALNPYEQFKQLTPAAVIDYSVFIFTGHFEIPLASALSHTQKAGLLLAQRQYPEAPAEAQAGRVARARLSKSSTTPWDAHSKQTAATTKHAPILRRLSCLPVPWNQASRRLAFTGWSNVARISTGRSSR